MLERAHSLAYIETQVSELLATRVLEIRERVLELRSMDPEADRDLLANKWTLGKEEIEIGRGRKDCRDRGWRGLIDPPPPPPLQQMSRERITPNQGIW